LTDANDHAPRFAEFPFSANVSATPKPGDVLLKLSAHDPDDGPNGQLTYNIVRPSQRERFLLSPEDGWLTVAPSADLTWEPGTAETVEVAVSDAGSPPRSSTGLVVVSVEGGPAVQLSFGRSVYESDLPENPPAGRDVAQMRAVRSDGRRQRVVYSILRGNELGAFEINSNNGLVRVRDPNMVDYELRRQFNLSVSARGLGDDEMVAYCTCFIRLQDVNDHPPKFTREHYTARVIEGLPRGLKIVETRALDADEGHTAKLRYEIIDGNVDGVFDMDPGQPGRIITTAVLDREIRSEYELTVSATDVDGAAAEGSPALVGIAQVTVEVVDANDNRPHIASMKPVLVSLSARPGSVLTTIRANDLDLAPRVKYRLAMPTHLIAVDSNTGQVILLKYPAPHDPKVLNLKAVASDAAHETMTEFEVRFVDEASEVTTSSGCFARKPLYNFLISRNASFPTAVGQIDLTPPCDKYEDVTLEVARRQQGLFSALKNGTLMAVREPADETTAFLLTLVQKSSGARTTSVVTVAKTSENVRRLELNGDTITIDAKLSGPVASIGTNQDPGVAMYFSMDPNPMLDVDSHTGAVYVTNAKANAPKSIKVTAERLRDGQTATRSFDVILKHKPHVANSLTSFSRSQNVVTMDFSHTGGVSLPICETRGAKATGQVEIASGNNDRVFSYDQETASLTLAKPLPAKEERRVVVLKMRDSLSLCSVIIENNRISQNGMDILPVLPLRTFVTSVKENSPIGTVIRGPPTGSASAFWTDSSSFAVDRRSGRITVAAPMDYESGDVKRLTIYANDTSGAKEEECQVEVLLVDEDEYPPAFGRSSYFFNLPGAAKAGHIVGRVEATDADAGPDGVVTFALERPSVYFAVDKRTGIVSLTGDLDTGVLQEFVDDAPRKKRELLNLRLTVKARSNQPDSLEAATLVVMSVAEEAIPVATAASGAGNWIIAVLLAFLLLALVMAAAVLLFCRYRSRKEEDARKLGLTGHSNAGMEMTGVPDALTRFPPQYSEIVSDYAHGKAGNAGSNARSELSEKSHRSASSGRGSVEDGDEEVDVEIRMINEGGYLTHADATASTFPPGGDDDGASEGSVQNTEDYLARLGIDVRKQPNIGGDMTDGYGVTAGGGSSIYNRIAEDALSERNSVLSARHPNQPSLLYGSSHGGGGQAASQHQQASVAGSLSSIVHSEDELAGSYNWDYLLDWGPQYQPLAHVFKEISQLKDDSTGSTAAGGGNVSALPFALRNPHTGHLLSRPARSPISHDMPGSGASALSPNFRPALSPLATKSPSVSPLSVPVGRGVKRL